jgi:hypothetical protein
MEDFYYHVCHGGMHQCYFWLALVHCQAKHTMGESLVGAKLQQVWLPEFSFCIIMEVYQILYLLAASHHCISASQGLNKRNLLALLLCYSTFQSCFLFLPFARNNTQRTNGCWESCEDAMCQQGAKQVQISSSVCIEQNCIENIQ